MLGGQWEIDAAMADYAGGTGNWAEPDAETSKGDEDGGTDGKAAAGGGQNSSFDIPGITKGVNDTLASSDCSAFVQTILNGVSSNTNPIYPAGGSLDAVFHAFLNQKKRHIFTRKLPAGSAGFANPSGNIKRGNAMIHIAGSLTLFDTEATISELFHLAGQNGLYSDKELATALSKSAYASLAYSRVGPQGPMWIAPEMNVFDSRYRGKPNWTEANQLAYSAYFHTIQSNTCRVLPGFRTQ